MDKSPTRLIGTVSYGLTLNLGNYQSSRIDASMEFFLDTQTFVEAFAELRAKVEAQAEAQKE